MLLQAVPNAIVQKIDSLRVLTESVVNAQQTQSVEIESIRDSVHTQLVALTAQLDKIPAFGLKYGDTVAHIAIPLIIALFAFAFAYMFSVFTRINQKYESENISLMFRRGGAYRFYMGGSVISIAYVVGFGVLTLLPSTGHREGLMAVLSWVCVIVAGLYAFFVLRFVLSCLRYVDHNYLLTIMETRYRRSGKSQESLDYYSKRLIDLGKYAIRSKNGHLFESILVHVNAFDKIEKKKTGKKAIPFTRHFYESIIDSFPQSSHGGELENMLFWYWRETLIHYKVPSPPFFFLMLKTIVKAVRQGRYGVFEGYVDKCQFYYEYINLIPVVRYIIGKDPTDQREADNNRLFVWRDVQECHYLAASYLFSIGHYEIVATLNKGIYSQLGSLFPSTVPEILKLYVDCKEKQDERSGAYHQNYWPFNDLGDFNYDRDILEKYTAMMLLVASQPLEERKLILSEKKLGLLRDSQNDLIKYGNIWKNHAEMRSRYPQIQGASIDIIVEEGIARFTDGEIESPRQQSRRRKAKEPKKYVYDLPLTAEGESSIREMLCSAIDTGIYKETKGLNGIDGDNKKETVSFGPYTFLINKKYVSTPDKINNIKISDLITNVIRQRYLYTLYGAFSQMSIKDVVTTWALFDQVFEKYVGNKADQYAIINSGLFLYGHLELDKRVDENEMSAYKGAFYYNAGTNTAFRQDKMPLSAPFYNTITIIRIADLPVLVPEEKDSEPPIVSFADESDKEKGWAVVRVTVDPCYAIRFSKAAKVLRIRIKE